MVIFTSKQKKFEGDLKIKLCGKRLSPTEKVKYLDVKIDANLSWQALLFKMRKYISLKYYDPSTLLFWTPTYPTALLSGLKIVALFNKL